jgi:hypothetical protein
MTRFPTRENQVTPQPAADAAGHILWCWEGDGPGAKLRTEVREEISSIKGRIAWFNGGTAAVSAIGLIILAAWLSSKFADNERNAIKHQDVESAIRRSAEMAASKHFDDMILTKRQFDQSAVIIPPPRK